MNIIAFCCSSGSKWWRIESVAKHITKNTEHNFYVLDANDWHGDTHGADIIIFQMMVNPDIVDQAHKQGAKVIYELDDLLTERTNREEVDNPQGFIDKTKITISKCDMVTTTVEPLAAEMRKLNKNVEILPNYIDLDWFGKPLDIKHRGKIRLGWAGSTSHASDLLFVKPIILRILKEYDNVDFIYCGAGGVSSDSSHTELFYGKDLFSEIPRERREYHLGSSTELWGKKSKTLHFDIGIAPLITDKFNACKSNIKWQEYSLNRIAGVYSDEAPYSDIKHAIKAKDQEEFYQGIKFLIDNPKEREKMAKLAQREVLLNWTLDKNYTKYLEVYQKCLNQ